MGISGNDGIFGNMFDLNGDGNKDFTEQALEFIFVDDLLANDEDDDIVNFNAESYDEDEEDDW